MVNVKFLKIYLKARKVHTDKLNLAMHRDRLPRLHSK